MGKQSKVLLGVAAIFILLVGITQIFFNRKIDLRFNSPISLPFSWDKTSPTPIKVVSAVEISVDFGGNEKISGYSYGRNVYESLKQLAAEKKIILETKEYKFGLMVLRIGEKTNNKEASWTYFVNGKGAEIAADRYLVSPGDKVEWKYIKF